MGRRRQDWAIRAAMLAGVLLGVWLLAQLSPGSTDVQVSPQQVVVPRTTTPRPPRLAPEPDRPAPQASQPVLEPADDEASIEVTDTADENVVVTLVLEDADGHVVDRGWPYVTGCPIVHHYREEDRFAVVVPYGSICTAWAQKQDGLLPVRTDRIEFDALPGTEIVLVFPAERTGGIGIRFQPMGDHVVVQSVLPGTPAWEAGLVPGDRIVSVGGVPVADLDTEGFVDQMTGPEGSDVEFELEMESDTGLSISRVNLTRAFLSG